MRRHVAALVAVSVLGSGIALAQVNAGYDGRKPEVAAGAKSLVFAYTPFQSNIEPIFVGSVDATDPTDLLGAGFRYFVGERLALGVGVNFGSANLKDDATGDELSTTTIGLAVELNYHLPSLYAVSPYVGGHVDYASLSAKLTPAGGTETKGSANGFGAAVQLGFDWFFTEGLSLGGRYLFGLRKYGAPEVDGATVGPSGTQIGTGAASVILNVHF